MQVAVTMLLSDILINNKNKLSEKFYFTKKRFVNLLIFNILHRQ